MRARSVPSKGVTTNRAPLETVPLTTSVRIAAKASAKWLTRAFLVAGAGFEPATFGL